MLTLGAPLALVGLLLVPAMRWLHRDDPGRPTAWVSHLGLWRGAAAHGPAALGRRPPDPAWRRRALLSALLVLALAQPAWVDEKPVVTLWVDDSLSMLTREPGGTRLALGWRRARALLDELPGAELHVRTLGTPWRELPALDDATLSQVGAEAGRRGSAPPPAALLARTGAHWLLTDGATDALLDWPGGRRPDRIVRVGGVSRNVGLEGLSARRSLDDPDRIDLLLQVRNGGTEAETRQVGVATPAGEAVLTTVELAPGASVTVPATVAAAATARAWLRPTDALQEDDGLSIDLGALERRAVAVDPACPEALVAALRSHPAVVVAPPAPTGRADAFVDCRGAPPAGTAALPTLRVHAEDLPAPLPGPLQWSPALALARPGVGTDGAGLRLAARLAPAPGDEVLLAAGGDPLILRRAGEPARVDTALDVATAPDRDVTHGSRIPLLVNLMLEQLLDTRLLDATVTVSRRAGASTVVPTARAAAAAAGPAAPAPGAARVSRDGSGPVLVLALLVLLWEMASLARRLHRARPAAPVRPS